MRALVCVSLLLFGTTAAVANNFPYEVVETANPNVADIVIKTPDGREATLKQSRSNLFSGSFQMTMTESICTQKMRPTSCNVILPVQARIGYFFWTKHPDPTKIGKIVLYKSKLFPVQAPLADGLVRSLISIHSEAAFGEASPKNKSFLVCDNYDFLFGENGALQKHVNIPLWSSESNLANLETEVSENMTMTGAFNVQMTAIYGQAFQIENAQFFALFPGAFPLIGGVNTLTTRSETGELCQSTFSVNLGRVEVFAGEVISDAQKQSFLPDRLSRYEKDRLLNFLTVFRWDEGAQIE